ncbi:replication initiation factor domain-containing protein [Vibrio vulnificus]|uniref:replication initiation factor domain-containing protein n=1 Tax=Vibrio vulnificus TaxID=672 RepID=UPI002FBE8357
MVRRAFGEGPLWGGTPKAERTPVLYYGGKFHQTSDVHLFLYLRTAVRGRSPKIGRNDEYYFNSDTGEKVFTKEQGNVGSRQSNVYYNKKLERNIEAEDFVWYRSEVELKKWDVDVILNPLAAFKGLCAYSSSLISDDITPVKTNRKSKSKKRVALDLVSAAYWMKRQYGKTLNALVEFQAQS